ncbi:MAG: V-type ATPase subunit [Sphaerochaetaceae bacterium]
MKSALTQYGFLNAKLRARMANLDESHIIDKMLDAPTLIQAIEVLRENPDYKKIATIYDESGDIQLIEKSLVDNEVGMRKELSKYLEDYAKDFSDLLIMKLEINNLKNIIRIWYDNILLGGNVGYRMNYVIKYKILNDIPWEALINAVNWEEIIKALKDTCYFEAVNRHSSEDIRKNGLVYFEMEMDVDYYKKLLDSLKHMSKRDRMVATDVLGVDLNIKNILNIIRYGKYYDIPHEKLYSLLLPGGSLYDSPNFKKSFKNKNVEEFLIKRFSKYDLESIMEATDKSELLRRSLKLEKELAEHRKNVYKKILRGYPFTIGLIMAYCFVYEKFNNSIQVILNGKYYGWDRDRIMEVV